MAAAQHDPHQAAPHPASHSHQADGAPDAPAGGPSTTAAVARLAEVAAAEQPRLAPPGGRRPIIAVTTSARGGRWMWALNRLSIRNAGGRARRITADHSADAESLAQRLDGVAGLIIGGGDDIAASLYGGDLTLDIKIDPARDALEQACLDHAVARDLPVLGICRGAQMLNIHFGGSLHQEIRTAFQLDRNRRTVLPVKDVEIDARSQLARLIGRGAIRVNSLHHQAIDRVADGLHAVAWDDHGIIQAIEDPHHPCRIGVQWHPEFLFYSAAHSRLFRHLIAVAAGARGLTRAGPFAEGDPLPPIRPGPAS